MKIYIDKKRIRLYLWIALAYYLLWLFTDIINNPDTILQRGWNYIWLSVFILVFNFVFFEYTLPFFKWKWKRLILVPFILWAHVMINTFGLYAWRKTGIFINLYFELSVYPSVLIGVENHAGFGIFSFFFFGIVKHIYDFRRLKQTAQQLIIEKQAAELNFLKSQTNPHFLFNTLNNIYSLARDKSELAAESILRLSKILRYILYETGGEYIYIEQELKIIDTYISLEKLRYDDSLKVNIIHDIEDMKQALPPLLLMPLVENAFKHGVSESRNNPFIDILLTVKNRVLNFTVKNSTGLHADDELPVKENIGLSNLRRQLELQFRDYDLSLSCNAHGFTAVLKINLSSHA